MALQDFEGALVVVSHDRHLLRSVTDTLLLVDSGRVSDFDGDLEDYRRWLSEQQREESADESTTAESENSAAARKERKRLEAEQRQRQQPLRKELQALEKQLDTLQAKKEKLEQQLTDPAIYADEKKDELRELLQEKGKLDQALAETEERWLELSEELEQAAS